MACCGHEILEAVGDKSRKGGTSRPITRTIDGSPLDKTAVSSSETGTEICLDRGNHAPRGASAALVIGRDRTFVLRNTKGWTTVPRLTAYAGITWTLSRPVSAQRLLDVNYECACEMFIVIRGTRLRHGHKACVGSSKHIRVPLQKFAVRGSIRRAEFRRIA